MSAAPDLSKSSAERDQTLGIRKSIANRYQLEAVVSGAGSFVLFGGSMLLFVLSVKGRKARPQYADVDWPRTPLPRGVIQVQYRRLFDLLAAFIILFFGALMLLLVWTNGIRIVSLIMVALIALFLIAFMFLIVRAKRKAVSMLDENGITRGDGRQFRWSEFKGVITEIDFTRVTKQRYLWRIKFAFESGDEAWIIPYRVKNVADVFGYLANLPRAYVKNQE